MSTTARLNELRARRAARALVEIHRAIDASILDATGLEEDEMDRLRVLRELAIAQLDRLGGRVRRNDPLRSAIEATCRSYRAWAAEEPGSDREQSRADALTIDVLRLRTALGVTVPRPPPSESNVLVIGPGTT